MSNSERRLEALERDAAQRRAQRGSGEDAMERIMTKLAAISTRLQDSDIEIEPLPAAVLAERLEAIRAHMRGLGR